MLRCRAIESQSYVIAGAQCGPHNEAKTRLSYGNSMIVNPWGEIESELGAWGEENQGPEQGVGAPQIAVADIDLSIVERVRAEMPLKRRTDVYPKV
jgi:deaminated glutathione amidase